MDFNLERDLMVRKFRHGLQTHRQLEEFDEIIKQYQSRIKMMEGELETALKMAQSAHTKPEDRSLLQVCKDKVLIDVSHFLMSGKIVPVAPSIAIWICQTIRNMTWMLGNDGLPTGIHGFAENIAKVTELSRRELVKNIEKEIDQWNQDPIFISYVSGIIEPRCDEANKDEGK